MPAHIWEITPGQGGALRLATRWEGKESVATFWARLLRDEQAFIVSGRKVFKAVLVDRQHFVIPGWCTNDARGGDGPDYDVVFSRPGIAELTAGRAYARYLEQIAQAGN